jgi:hypothetical protein
LEEKNEKWVEPENPVFFPSKSNKKTKFEPVAMLINVLKGLSCIFKLA